MCCRSLFAMPLSALWACLLCCGSTVGFPVFPEHAVWLGTHLLAVYGLRSAVFSVLCPLRSYSVWFSEILQLPLGVACEGASQCMGTLNASGLPPLGYKLLSRSSPSFPFLCLHPLSYFIPGSLACPSWRPEVFCCLLKVLL